jgi:hypothetical protein
MAAIGNLASPNRVGATSKIAGYQKPRTSPACRWSPHGYAWVITLKPHASDTSIPTRRKDVRALWLKHFPRLSSLAEAPDHHRQQACVLPAHGALSGTQDDLLADQDVCQRTIWFVVSCPWSVVKTTSAGLRNGIPRYGRLTTCFTTCGNIAPAHVSRFSADGAKCLVRLVK